MTLHEVSEFTSRGLPRFMADQLKKPDFKKDWSTYKQDRLNEVFFSGRFYEALKILIKREKPNLYLNSC